MMQMSKSKSKNRFFRHRWLKPAVKRLVGLAVLDRRQSSPATLAFIELATRLQLD